MAACSTTRRNSRERSESIEKFEVRKFEVRSSKFEVSPQIRFRFVLRTSYFVLPSYFRLQAFTIRRQLAARRTVHAVAEEVIGLHDLVNLARAFVDDRALAIAVEASGRVLVRVPIGAVDLHAVGGGALRRDRREPLRQAGLPR